MTNVYKVGQLIQLSDGRAGTVRFVGHTYFSAGDWIGVEFEGPEGKNDGSVQGTRYFDCEPGHGMFLKPTAVKQILEEPTPKPASASGAPKVSSGTGATAKPGALQNGVAKRPERFDPMAAKRQSMNAASPTPGARERVNGIQSPTKLATRATGSTATSSAASSRGATPSITGRATTQPKTSTTSRVSIAPAATKSSSSSSLAAGRASRPSVAASTSAPTATSRPSSTVSRLAGGTAAKPSTTTLAQRSASKVNGVSTRQSRESTDGTGSSPENKDKSPEPEEEEVDTQAAQEKDATALEQNEASGQEEPDHAQPLPPQAASSKAAAKAPLRPVATSKQIEELESKLRLMEKKRAEDKEQLMSLERVKADKDRFEGIIQKLQTKLQPMQQELSELRKKTKDAEQQLAEAQTSQAEHDESLEMATLDREMAEEVAEGLRTELEALKAKAEEMQLEVEVLREENQELGQEMSPEERSTQSWLHLERSNERLRDALIRLREVTQEEEAKLKSEIESLKDDMQQFENLQQQHEEAKERLRQSEEAVEDLRQQLDAALGAEDMVEALTEKNLRQTEQIDDLKLTVEDLENLKELNDELEFNHVETERQLQEELDFQESLAAEHVKRATQQEEKLQDYEYTIVKFRELVSNLQSDLQDTRASQQLTEAEAEELNSRSKAITDLNMRLQNSAAKTQANTVDLELRRLDAQEAVEHLTIVQMFMPEGFRSERDSVLAYLRFKRVSFKAQLLHGFLKDRLNQTATARVPENAFLDCDILDKLVGISAVSDRFVSAIARCSLERFAKFESTLQELDPIERGLNGYIDAWKKNDLKEQSVAQELQRSTAVLFHLAETYLENDVEGYADSVLMRMTLMQSHLENSATALAFSRSILEQNSPVGQEDEDDMDNPLLGAIRQLESLVSQSRSAKVVTGKAMGSLLDLKSRNMAIVDTADSLVDTPQEATSNLASLVRGLGQALYSALEQQEGVGDGTPASLLSSAISSFSRSAFPDSQDSNSLNHIGNRLRSISEQLSALLNLCSDLSRTIEFETATAPWVLRSKALQSTKLSALDTEQENKRLRDAQQEHLARIWQRDQTLEEQAVKIEHLEHRMRDATAKADQISELSATVAAAKKREVDLSATIDAKLSEARALQVERDRWRQLAEERNSQVVNSKEVEEPNAARAAVTSRELEALKLEIRGLQGTVRHLRAADSKRVPFDSAGGTLQDQLSWLSEPLSPQLMSKQEIEAKESTAKLVGGVFDSLLDLVAGVKPVDLCNMPENKLKWRPMKDKSAWKVARQAEDWARWSSKRDVVLRKHLTLMGRI